MGINDIGIIAGIVTFFIVVGFMTPYVNSEFGSSYTERDYDALNDGLTDELGSSDYGSLITGWKTLGYVLSSVFFWTFGGIPVWLNLVFWILRLTMYITIARNIWIGGGG